MKKGRFSISILLYICFGVIGILAVYQLGSYALEAYKSQKQANQLAGDVTIWDADAQEENAADALSKESDDADSLTGQSADGNLNSAQIPTQIDFASLQAQNEDVVAWLYLPETQINYPVAFSGDNETYLHTDINGDYSRAGTLFVDGDATGDFSEWNTIIYGHNMKNGSMFKTITNYADSDFYEEHPMLYLYTEDARYQILPVLGCIVDDDDALYGIREYSEENLECLNALFRKSTFDSGESITEMDQLITLSTCSYEYDGARYVLVGKMVEW